MSRFSDLCKFLIKENGTNVYQVSKETSLDLTTLQRMTTGKRLPSKEFVYKLCSYLRISDSELSELIELYDIEQMGEIPYFSYKYIKKLFNHLYDLENNAVNAQYLENYSQHFLDPLLSQRLSILAESALISMISALSNSENAYVYTNFPANHSFAHYIELLNIHQKQHIQILHLISLYQNNIDNLSNLASLLTILPYTLTAETEYTPYFVYNHIRYAELQNMMYPFYFITNHQVLLLSANFQEHIILSDQDSVKKYTEQFKTAIQQANILIHKTNMPQEAFKFYDDANPALNTSFYGVEHQLCFTNLLTPEDFMKGLNLRLPNLDHFLPFIQSLFMQKKTFFYTKEGVDFFCETGKFYGQAASLLPPLSKDSIIHLLDRYLHSPKTSSSFMLKEEIKFPQHINVELNEKKQLHIMKIIGNSYFLLLTINEPSICETFYDFFQFLQKSDNVYSPDESKTYLMAKLDQLKSTH